MLTKLWSFLLLFLFIWNQSFSQSAADEEVMEHEQALEYYFRKDKYRKAEKAYQWLWINHPYPTERFS